METLVVAVHVMVAVAIVVLILLQQGKGADAGAAFGSGASQTMFGSAGTGNFLTRTTTIAAVVFFATSLTLAIYAKQQSERGFDDGLPVFDTDLLPVPQDSDIPQIVEPQEGTGSDIPELPQQ
jgi:preprotein translocase subunit SecG